MANPVTNVSNAHQVAQVAANQPQAQAAKQPPKQAAAPQDTVTISAAGKAASQVQPAHQPAKSSGEVNYKGAKK